MALEPDPTGFDEVGYGDHRFARVAAATADRLNEFAEIVNRPLDFVWDFFHKQLLHSL